MMNDITNRFIEVYNHLLERGQVNNAKDFAKKVGISASLMTEVLKDRTNIGINAIQNTVINFEVSAEWILTGKGDIINNCDASNRNRPPGRCVNCAKKDLEIKNIEKALKHAETALRMAEGEIESRKETIALLTDKINYLSDENSRQNNDVQHGQKRKSA